MSKINGGVGPYSVALIGPYGSGKTTLLESLLHAVGAIPRKGSVTVGNTVGDSSAEARNRGMSTELNCASLDFMGDRFTFLDCPGSIEFLQETLNVLPVIDAAIVVCEPDPAKTQMLKPYLKRLADLNIPHILFINKIDKASGSQRALLSMLQEVSDKPLLLRQIPLWEDGAVTGFVDLALERAYVYRPHAASNVIEIADWKREKEARFQMLERLADHDEHLMEELLSDAEPPASEVFTDLARELSEGLVVPVLMGSAEGDNGVRRLLKALRHELPGVAETVERLKIASGSPVIRVFKTLHSAHGGKLSLARVLSGSVKDGSAFAGSDGEVRIGGIFALRGGEQSKVAEAKAGDTVAFAKLEGVVTGDTLGAKSGARPEHLAPVYGLAVSVQDQRDEVKLTAALSKLQEEDPSLGFEQNSELHEMSLLGQGEIHLKVAVDKLANKYGVKVKTQGRRVPYKETIRKKVSLRGRHKKQSGGHGQYGDVVLEIAPLPRGSGFTFTDRIVGGVVPKQWIPSVEKGIREYMKSGPLGFPVVDFTVALTDGSYHSVDSSDAAFQMAARACMSEAMPGASPVLLEPIMRLKIHVPNSATAKVNSVVNGRRGSLMGYDAREGWTGWDTVEAEMPLSEISDLIVELRSLTQGTGTYEMTFDHLAELSGKLADTVVSRRSVAAE